MKEILEMLHLIADLLAVICGTQIAMAFMAIVESVKNR